MPMKIRRTHMGVAAALLALAGGGGAIATAGAASSTTLHLKASTSKLRFSKSRLTARAGTITLSMANPSSGSHPHGIAVEGHGVDKDGRVVQPGHTSTVRVTLKKGTYEFYCPIPAHKKAGMKGTLVVT